jgi:FKBP-type peptidyl-prolyl cis-trans isomerase (trigger factor)
VKLNTPFSLHGNFGLLQLSLNLNLRSGFLLKKRLILISAGLVLTIGLAACSNNDKGQEENTQVAEETTVTVANPLLTEALEPNDPVARVNGEEISQQELTTQYEQVVLSYQQQGMAINEENQVQIKRHVLDQLVNTMLISQAAGEAGFTSSEDEVQAQLAQIKEQYGDEEKLNQVLEMNNLTIASLEKIIKQDLTINKYLVSTIEVPSVSDDEIEERYKQYEQQTENMPKLEEIKAQLEDELKSEKNQEAIAELVNKLKETSQIDILI